jgi:hypothetical protein
MCTFVVIAHTPIVARLTLLKHRVSSKLLLCCMPPHMQGQPLTDLVIDIKVRCTCGAGFESQPLSANTTVVKCNPCKAGRFRSVTMGTCQPCPLGELSQQV